MPTGFSSTICRWAAADILLTDYVGPWVERLCQTRYVQAIGTIMAIASAISTLGLIALLLSAD